MFDKGPHKSFLLDLLSPIAFCRKAQSCSVRVFGLDPVANPVGVLGRIGYLSEDRNLPNWMRVKELMRYTQAFYPSWDEAYAEELRAAFDLDPIARVKNLPRGQRARAGLLVALAHRPELLVLDEPSSGLYFHQPRRRVRTTAVRSSRSGSNRCERYSAHAG